MPLKIIDEVLKISLNLFGFANDIEISLEANPSSYKKEKFYDLKKIGINRLSIGVQSLNDVNLELGKAINITQKGKTPKLAHRYIFSIVKYC